MYVIFKTTEEKDYGYGGWKDSYTKYFEVIAVTADQDTAMKKVTELEKADSGSWYDYEWAENLDAESKEV